MNSLTIIKDIHIKWNLLVLIHLGNFVILLISRIYGVQTENFGSRGKKSFFLIVLNK